MQFNYVSLFLNFVFEIKLLKGYKIPNFSTFSREIRESTVDHVVRCPIECGDLALSENSKKKYFPSFLTKCALTWFTTLPSNLIHNWVQLERNFHEQFFRGETQVSLIDLMNVKRFNNEN